MISFDLFISLEFSLHNYFKVKFLSGLSILLVTRTSPGERFRRQCLKNRSRRFIREVMKRREVGLSMRVVYWSKTRNDSSTSGTPPPRPKKEGEVDRGLRRRVTVEVSCRQKEQGFHLKRGRRVRGSSIRKSSGVRSCITSRKRKNSSILGLLERPIIRSILSQK